MSMKPFLLGFILTLAILIFMDVDEVIEVIEENTATA